MNKPLFFLGIIVLLTGITFTLLSHDSHNALLGAMALESSAHEHTHEEHGSHDLHQTTGIAAALLGIVLIIGGLKL